jgi:hypothetical protein
MDEGREKGDEQSAPSADNPAAPAATKRHNIVSIKAGQNLDGSAASKVDLMREANASLTLVAEIIRVDQEYWGILLAKPHDIGPVQVQCRCTRHLVQYNHPLTINETKPSSETVSVWNKCGMTMSDAEAVNRGNQA